MPSSCGIHVRTPFRSGHTQGIFSSMYLYFRNHKLLQWPAAPLTAGENRWIICYEVQTLPPHCPNQLLTVGVGLAVLEPECAGLSAQSSQCSDRPHLKGLKTSPGQKQLVAAPFDNTDRSKAERREASVPATVGRSAQILRTRGYLNARG